MWLCINNYYKNENVIAFWKILNWRCDCVLTYIMKTRVDCVLTNIMKTRCDCVLCIDKSYLRLRRGPVNPGFMLQLVSYRFLNLKVGLCVVLNLQYLIYNFKLRRTGYVCTNLDPGNESQWGLTLATHKVYA